jgi:hypothetical protein
MDAQAQAFDAKIKIEINVTIFYLHCYYAMVAPRNNHILRPSFPWALPLAPLPGRFDSPLFIGG